MSPAPPRHAVVVGATAVLAACTARCWAARGTRRFTLIGRDRDRLEAVATDLRLRADGVDAAVVALDLTDPRAISAAIEGLAIDEPDAVLIAHGVMHAQAALEHDLVLAEEQLRITGVSPVLWLEGFADALGPDATVAVIGSVAGDRGRASNLLYGAAKGMIERAAQGLQHRRDRRGGPRIVLIKPGPTRTPMTAALGSRRLADPDDVARGIAAAVARGSAVAYVPRRWGLIMAVVRIMPRRLLARLDL